MILVCLLFGLTWANNTFTYNTNSTNDDRALLALESNPYTALYGSLALNETHPNIVYYGVGLDAGALSIRLNAFMENSEHRQDRVVMNATIYPESLIEYGVDGQATDNEIRFANTSTGWIPIGTGILSLSNTTLIPDGLVDSNVTVISTTWTGPQQDESGRNVTALFNVFIAPPVEAMGRIFMNSTKDQLNQNTTGVIAAVTISNFPFRYNGTLALRNLVKINETIYSVDQPVNANVNKTVPFVSFGEEASSFAVVNRNTVNLVRNFSRTQFERMVVEHESFRNGNNQTLILEGIVVDLLEIESVLPRYNSGLRVRASLHLVALSCLLAVLLSI